MWIAVLQDSLEEAIAWRLSKTCPYQLKRTERVFAGSEEETWKLHMECYAFFLRVIPHLREWEASPFGGDLKADLALLPERKQEEHIQRLEKLREDSKDSVYMILSVDILRTAQEKWTEQDGPWHLYLGRKLVEFFPFGKKRGRLSKKPRGFAAS